MNQRIVIPRGTINADETVVIEIPMHLKDSPMVIARPRRPAQPPRPRSPLSYENTGQDEMPLPQEVDADVYQSYVYHNEYEPKEQAESKEYQSITRKPKRQPPYESNPREEPSQYSHGGSSTMPQEYSSKRKPLGTRYAEHNPETGTYEECIDEYSTDEMPSKIPASRFQEYEDTFYEKGDPDFDRLPHRGRDSMRSAQSPPRDVRDSRDGCARYPRPPPSHRTAPFEQHPREMQRPVCPLGRNVISSWGQCEKNRIRREIEDFGKAHKNLLKDAPKLGKDYYY